MTSNFIEHVNLTVSDARRSAKNLEFLFGWKLRWDGPSQGGGYTIHVGDENQYVALYQPKEEINTTKLTENTLGHLNHVGVVVKDLDAMDKRVRAAGFTPGEHEVYEPGRRFYFVDQDGIEFEIVSYP